MEKLIISGNQRLGGEIDVHGSKNAVLPILAASLLINGETILHNVPDLSDVSTSVEILEYLGASVKREESTLIIDASTLDKNTIPENMMREMRSSIIFLGSLLARCREVMLCRPGGCDIGVRPIDLHLSALKKLGAQITENGNCIYCSAGRLNGAKLVLSFPSVGATENIMLAGVTAKGKTTIINAAREPEICDLAQFLNSCGAKIFGAGESVIEIEGVSALYPASHTVIPDRIVASTYLCVGALQAKELVVRKIRPSHLMPVIPVFSEMGCKLFLSKNEIRIVPPKRLRRVKNIKTMPYPGFPTDCQSVLMAVLSKANGTSVFNESVFEGRYKHISELKRFGADITVDGRIAVVNGVKNLYGANVYSTDLRGGASLVIAALAAEGASTVGNVYHIDRGYEHIEKNLQKIGAVIKRKDYEEEKTKQSAEQ